MTDTTTLDALDNITRLALKAETWKVRATDAEAELNDILTAIDPDHTGALTASHAVRTVIRTLTRRATDAEAKVARLREQVATLHLHLGRLLDLLDDTETAKDYAEYDEALSAWEDTCPDNTNQDAR